MVNHESLSNNNLEPDWDMSDVGEMGATKPEEQRNYESRERALQDELMIIVNKRAGYISGAGEECAQVLRRAEHPFAKRIENNVDDIVAVKRNAGQHALESLFGFIDAVYPSPYATKESKPDEMEDEYRQMAMREGNATGDTVDELAKTFSIDGSDNDLHVASILRNIGQDSSDYQNGLSRAIIEYAKHPTPENRNKLNRIQYDHSGALTNSLFNIADTFDNSRTEIGKKLFDPTVALASMLARSSDEYFEGIMGFMKFKMENSSVKPPVEEAPSQDMKPLADLFL